MSGISINEKLSKESSGEDFISDLALEIIKARKEKNMSLEDVAAKAEVDVEIVKKLESFNYNDVEMITLIKILDALDLKVKITLQED